MDVQPDEHSQQRDDAVVGEHARIGKRCVLYPHAVIYEGAEIGDDFTAHSHSVVREYCRIGSRVLLQNGVVVGGDGYGFAKRADGTHHKIVQSGVTVIEERDLWDMPILLMLLLALIAAEWGYRRMRGLA